jgi:hypothetical protein
MGKVFGRGFTTNNEKTEEVSDEVLGKIFEALESASRANEIDVSTLTESQFIKFAKRAFVAPTEEPTRMLAYVKDAAGDGFVRVTDDADEASPWSAVDEGYYHSWSELLQPVVVVTRGVSAETLAKWEAKAKGDIEALAKFEKGEGFEEDPTRAPASVPVEHRADGRDL